MRSAVSNKGNYPRHNNNRTFSAIANNAQVKPCDSKRKTKHELSLVWDSTVYKGGGKTQVGFSVFFLKFLGRLYMEASESCLYVVRDMSLRNVGVASKHKRKCCKQSIVCNKDWLTQSIKDLKRASELLVHVRRHLIISFMQFSLPHYGRGI